MNVTIFEGRNRKRIYLSNLPFIKTIQLFFLKANLFTHGLIDMWFYSPILPVPTTKEFWEPFREVVFAVGRSGYYEARIYRGNFLACSARSWNSESFQEASKKLCLDQAKEDAKRMEYFGLIPLDQEPAIIIKAGTSDPLNPQEVTCGWKHIYKMNPEF